MRGLLGPEQAQPEQRTQACVRQRRDSGGKSGRVAQMAVFAAEKARRQRQAANAASEGGRERGGGGHDRGGSSTPSTQGEERAKRATGPASEGSQKS